MKNVLKFSLFLFLIACKDDIASPESRYYTSEITLSGATYNHKIEDCSVDPSFENSCVDWLVFRKENEVDYLIGGGDIIHRGRVETKNDTLLIFNKDSETHVLTFLASHPDTLLEVTSNQIWVKDKDL